MLAPIQKLLQKDTSWHWGPEQVNAFEESKIMLQSSQVLVHYNPKLPYNLVLSCDASPCGIGAVFSHQMADETDY